MAVPRTLPYDERKGSLVEEAVEHGLGHTATGVGDLNVDFLLVGGLFDADFAVRIGAFDGIRQDIVPHDIQHATVR